MKKIVTIDTFVEEFEEYNRKDSFSYDGLKALFNYLEEYEEAIGKEIELDVIGLCCEFTEYENLEELKENYTDIETMEDLQDNTTVIMIDDNRFIIQDY